MAVALAVVVVVIMIMIVAVAVAVAVALTPIAAQNTTPPLPWAQSTRNHIAIT